MSNTFKIMSRDKVSDSRFKESDAVNYKGRKYEVSDGKGNVIESGDTRILSAEKYIKAREFREATFNEITAKYSMIDQANALAGRLTAEEAAAMNTFIDTVRAKYKSYKDTIASATNFEEVEAIIYRTEEELGR